MKIAIAGFGSVGQTVARLAHQNGHSVVALADSKSAIIDSSGIDINAALSSKKNKLLLGDGSMLDLLESDYDVLIEATPTFIGDAEPAFNHIKTALEMGHDVVTANKGPIAERYDEIQNICNGCKGSLRFEATVGGAIPIISTIEDRSPKNIISIRGVLNGTSNFILERMGAKSLSYDHVLLEAQDLGVAETDPSFDVGGIDTALKCVIMSNMLSGGGFSLSDAKVEGIEHISNHALDLAKKESHTIRLIGESTRDGIHVSPKLVPKNDVLAVKGTQNIAQINTKNGGALNLIGPGAGGGPTAAAIFADLKRLQV